MQWLIYKLFFTKILYSSSAPNPNFTVGSLCSFAGFRVPLKSFRTHRLAKTNMPKLVAG
jgi:hypothetical protein